MLKRCFTEDCSCAGWHNQEKLPIRDPILDVWRRQFLRQGFKPCPVAQSEFFSVCLRIPQCLLDVLLAASGNSGAYCEPRSADGQEIFTEYTVVWTPDADEPSGAGPSPLGRSQGVKSEDGPGQDHPPISST